MSININDSEYSTLNTYTVLVTNIYPSGDKSKIYSTFIITNGSYGAKNGGYSETIIGTKDSDNITTASLQLTNFKLAITTYINKLPSSTIPTPFIFKPNINYTKMTAFFTGAIIFDAEGDSNAKFFVTVTTTTNFDNVSSVTLINGASNCNIFWISQNFTMRSNNNNVSIQGLFLYSRTCRVFRNFNIIGRVYCTGDEYSSLSSLQTNIVLSINGALDCTQNIVCYVKGTLILTNQGFVPIENIKAGYKVITKGKIYNNKFFENEAKIEPVIWISKFNVINLNEKSRPICIKKDALSKNNPFKDLYVSPNHALLLNGKIVLAKNILNGKTIYQDNECDSVEYYHLECENHSAIIANGILAETYLYGNNNRNVFENSIRLRRKIDLKKYML